MEEEWHDIVGYEQLYQVSNLGNVKRVCGFRCNKEHFIKQIKEKGGYLRVQLCRDGIKVKKLVHRLVASAFIKNEENKQQIDHIDGNPSNNNANNLRWCTTKENQSNLITRARKRDSKRGKLNPMFGVTGSKNKCSIPVICVETGELFWGAHEAERKTGANNAKILAVCRGVRKTTGGFTWKYATKGEYK